MMHQGTHEFEDVESEHYYSSEDTSDVTGHSLTNESSHDTTSSAFMNDHDFEQPACDDVTSDDQPIANLHV